MKTIFTKRDIKEWLFNTTGCVFPEYIFEWRDRSKGLFFVICTVEGITEYQFSKIEHYNGEITNLIDMGGIQEWN